MKTAFDEKKQTNFVIKCNEFTIFKIFNFYTWQQHKLGMCQEMFFGKIHDRKLELELNNFVQYFWYAS